MGKIQWPKIPVSHPQPSPWSEELDQFCTRVFKNQITTKLAWLLFEPPGLPSVFRSLWPVLSPPDNVSALPGLRFMSQSGVSGECEHEVRVRLLQNLAHVSIQTPYGVQGSQGREGWEGQTLPRQSSPLARAPDGIPRAHPPFPPPQLRWRGSSCHQSLCW